MRCILCLFSLSSFALIVVLPVQSVNALTRAPQNNSEKSLLYWRYLCREQPQTDTVREETRELSCLKKGWKVRASEKNGRVTEVILDDPS